MQGLAEVGGARAWTLWIFQTWSDPCGELIPSLALWLWTVMLQPAIALGGYQAENFPKTKRNKADGRGCIIGLNVVELYEKKGIDSFWLGW